MKQLRFFTLSICAIALSSCQAMDGLVQDIDSLDLPSLSMSESSTDQLIYDGKCPHVEIVEELRAFNDFTDLSDPGDYNLISRATIAKIDTACSYDQRSVTVDLKMAFEGQLGPRAKTSASDKPFFSYPFFVAVTGAGGDILAKEIFAASMTYPAGENRQTYHENMRQIIPVESRDRGARYKILVGFQLNPDQLAYNRHKEKQSDIAIQASQPKPEAIQIKKMEQDKEAMAKKAANKGNPIDITNQP